MLEEILEKTTIKDIIPIIIISIAIVSFWRGIWGLMDLYIYPNNSLLSHSISVGIGLIVIIAITFYRRKGNKK